MKHRCISTPQETFSYDNLDKLVSVDASYDAWCKQAVSLNWAASGFQLNAKGLGDFATGAAGLANGVSSTGFLAGAAVGASSGFAGGFILSTGNSWLGGTNFGKGLLAGLGTGLFDALTGGLMGGVFGGLDALDNHTSFWTGMGKFDTTGAMACQGGFPGDFSIGDKIKAKYVGKFKEQKVFESEMLGDYFSGNYSAFTLPDRGIIVGKGVFTSGSLGGRAMMQHEFGHVLQYRKVGAANYYAVIANESLLNCGYDRVFGTDTHSTFWTETWANYLSRSYFGKKWLGVEKFSQNTIQLYYPSKNPSRLLKFMKFGLKGLLL